MNKTKSLLMIILPLVLVFGLYLSVTGLEKPIVKWGPTALNPNITTPAHFDVPNYLPGETEAEMFKKSLSDAFIADMPLKPPYNGPENIPTGKQGGEDVGTAVAITTIPGTVTGSTAGYADDYDEVCPYGPHTSPDVVYSYTPSVDEVLDLTLCNSSYDTKMFVYEDAVTAGAPYACNDDDGACPGYQSSLYELYVYYGHTYYIVIDGYDGDYGDYVMDMSYYEAPDEFECPPGAFTEAEPCGDDTNGGCNMATPAFEPIDCGDTVCGTVWAADGTRDTDWYQLTLTQPTVITWTATAEFLLVIGVVDTSDCSMAGSLDPYATGNPGDVISCSRIAGPGNYWLFVSHQDYYDTPCGTDNDYWAAIDCEPITSGACCDPATGDCTPDVEESPCLAMYGGTGVWMGGYSCDPNPCEQPATPGDNCSEPYTLTLPADLPVGNSNSTCGRINDYDATCMGYYDGGEDMIYEIVVTSDVYVAITMDPLGSTWNGIGLDLTCPLDASSCIAVETGSSSDPKVIEILLTVGTYYLMVDTWPSPTCIDFYLTIETATEPVGRCCYGEPTAPSCADIIASECAATGTMISWDADMNCTDNPCMAITPGDNCTDPFQIKVPEDLTFVQSNYTCGRVDDYDETCMGYYDGGEDIIYELDVDANVNLIFTLDPLGTTWIGMGLDASCPLDASTCIATVSASSGVIDMTVALTPGFYYLMIDTWPSPDCIEEFVLTIEEDTCTPPPNNNCEDVTPVALADGVPHSFFGDNTCSTNDCVLLSGGFAWEAFTISTLSNLTLDYCGTTPNFELIYIVLADACPCDAGSGEYILADATDWGLCGGDGNVTMWYYQLPAGTYYIPVLSDHPDYPTHYYEGPYQINVLAEETEAEYCAGSGGCDEYIENVTVESINNTSACEGYGDFTSQIAYMAYSVGYPITITIGGAWSSDAGGVWVDWNQDMDWDDPGEQITLDVSTGYGPYTGTITPPGDALAGPTRMRVRLCYACTPAPCGTESYGEVEDYTIIVGGTPSTFTVDPEELDLGTVPLDATGSAPLTLGAVGEMDINFSMEVDYDRFGGHPGGNFGIGTTVPEKAPSSGQSSPPNQNVIRQGGDVIGSATVIGSDTYTNTGTTAGYINDYDEVCPYTGSTAPDVVYSYAATADMEMDVDMWGSAYDTKIYIYENDVTTLAACNDDYYSDYTSALFNVPITTGNTYYIVVDGYGTSEGDYSIAVTVHDAPDPFECPPGSIAENEPCGDDTNGGCNMTTPAFEQVNCGDTICGTVWADGGTRDTDWFTVTINEDGPITFTASAEFPFVIGFLETTVPGAPTCDNITGYLEPYATGNPYDVISVSIPDAIAGEYWLFVSHQDFYDYPCGTDNDYWMTADCDPGVAPIYWLDPQPTSGLIPGDGTFPITVNFDVTGLELGVHTANLNITHTGAKGFTVVPVTITVGGGNDTTQVDPDPIYAIMAFSTEDLDVVFYLGGEFDGGGHVVEDIDLALPVTIDGEIGTVTASDLEILPSLEGFTGSVLKITADMSDFIETYPLMWDTEEKTFTINGTYTAGPGFAQAGPVTTVGHRSGDANFDGAVNIFDISYNIAYLYKGGPEPMPILLTGDANGDGLVNIMDVSYLISFLYKGGPAPIHQ